MKYIDIRDYKYLLWETEVIQTSIFPPDDIIFDAFALLKDGTLILRGRLFLWDGASGPTFDTGDSMLGSAVHDAFYRMFRLGVLGIEWRQKADETLHDICVSEGMSKERAEVWYVGVRLFAEGCAEPDGKPEFEILCA